MSDQSRWSLGPFTYVGEVLGANPEVSFHCPVLDRDVAWAAKDLFNPAAIVRDDVVHLLVRGEDLDGPFAGTSRIGLATSTDGRSFELDAEPVIFPDHDEHHDVEWPGGCEDARVVESPDGGYVCLYSAFDATTCILSVATSSELRTWTKHGAAFKGTPYERRWSKSGSIVTEIREGRLIAARIDGRFWMYWGEGVCFAATSEDLVTWQLVEFDAGADRFLTFDADRASWRVHRVKGSRVLRPVAVARAQRFDSLLVEPGPPAVLTEDGIVLVYNGAALATDSNGALTGVSYRVGAMLLDTHEPASVLARTTQSVMEAPRAALDGQVPNVCFAQGLVAWRGEWILYLGLGDSRIGMARSAMNMSGVG